MPRRKLTAKQQVLKRYPDAYAKQGSLSGDWYVYAPKRHWPIIGISGGDKSSASKAWQNAAESL